jgi:cysteine desulfurase/selenocysteine lyase
MYGPMGVGVLWGRRELLAQAPPFIFGGEMIERVEKYLTTFAAPPAKFEAGTLPAADIVGLGAAVAFLRRVGWPWVQRHERMLTRHALDGLSQLPGLTVYGPTRLAERAGIISFNLAGVHAHDVAQILDRFGIAVRAGHHCAMPLMAQLGVPATVRASFGVYNTREDVDRLVEGIKQVQKVFRTTGK